jgi:hypothetical protein
MFRDGLCVRKEEREEGFTERSIEKKRGRGELVNKAIRAKGC